MGKIIIKLEKDDIKVSELGECFFVECNNNIALIITLEALKELVDDYNTIISGRNTPGGERGKGSCPECGEGYNNEEELLKIPDEYDTIEKKLEYLDELSLIEQKKDRMEQYYSFRLFRTKEYWKNKLKNDEN
jgi:hypothetical protein